MHYKEQNRFAKKSDLIGRTIAQIVDTYVDRLVIRFTDGTYTTITAEGENCGDAKLEFGELLELIEAKEVGLISEEEYMEGAKKCDAEIEEERKTSRRRLYEELKKEFEEPGKS